MAYDAARQRWFYLKHRDRLIAKSLQWRIDNPEKRRIQKRSVASKAASLRYYYRHREAMIKQASEWRKNHPVEARLILARTMAKRRYKIKGQVTPAHIAKLISIQRGLCYWCRMPYGEKFHIDHVWPLSKGGKHSPRNIVLTCANCNHRKSAKTPMEFAGVLF